MSSSQCKAVTTRITQNIGRIKRVVTVDSTVPPRYIKTLITAYALPVLTYCAHILPYTADCLKKIRGKIAIALATALKMHRTHKAHRASVLSEFAVAPPLYLTAESTLKYTEKLVRSPNAAGAQWRATISHPQLAAISALTKRVHTARTALHTPIGGTRSAIEALRMELATDHYGQPLRQATASSHQQPSTTTQHYLSLSPTVAVRFAAL